HALRLGRGGDRTGVAYGAQQRDATGAAEVRVAGGHPDQAPKLERLAHLPASLAQALGGPSPGQGSGRCETSRPASISNASPPTACASASSWVISMTGRSIRSSRASSSPRNLDFSCASSAENGS